MKYAFKSLLLSIVKGYREIFDKEYANKLIFKKRKKELVNEVMTLEFDKRLELMTYLTNRVIRLSEQESLDAIKIADNKCQESFDSMDKHKRRINLLKTKKHELQTINDEVYR